MRFAGHLLSSRAVSSKMPTPWSEQEDIYLCTAFVNVSEDSSVGTDQTSSRLWERVFEKFEELRKLNGGALVREKSATLQTRWAGKIKPDLALFVNILYQVIKSFYDSIDRTKGLLTILTMNR